MKKAILAGVLAVSMFTASCLGPNEHFEGLRDWNQQATENRWANEVIFLGMTILPVYSLVYLADIVIFNSIVWWDGDE